MKHLLYALLWEVRGAIQSAGPSLEIPGVGDAPCRRVVFTYGREVDISLGRLDAIAEVANCRVEDVEMTLNNLYR